jgi:aldehyde dehydrogenase (NAD+)
VVGRLRAGIVTVNAWSSGGSGAFGGYKRSGNGREGGKWGLVDFLEVKTIVGC